MSNNTRWVLKRNLVLVKLDKFDPIIRLIPLSVIQLQKYIERMSNEFGMVLLVLLSAENQTVFKNKNSHLIITGHNAHGLKSRKEGRGGVGLAQIFAKILGRSRLSGQNCHGAQWEKYKILCHHQKIYNYKNILFNRYFNLTSSQGTLFHNQNPIFALRTLFSILKSQNSKRHSFLSLPLFFRK